MNFLIFDNKRLYFSYVAMMIFDFPMLAVLAFGAVFVWVVHVFILSVILLFSNSRLMSIILTLGASLLIAFYKFDHASSDFYYRTLFLVFPLWVGVLIGYKRNPGSGIER